MDVVKLLAEAEQSGVKIEVVDGDLQIEANRSKKHWLEKLRPHKQEILSHLNGEPTDEEIGEAPKQAEHYKPFPVHCLPAIVGKFVGAASKAIGCDPAFIALPLMACLARAIGNKRVIRLKRSWVEPSIIWAAIVGKSGTHKTPALSASTRFLDRKQAESIAKHVEAMTNYEQEKAYKTR